MQYSTVYKSVFFTSTTCKQHSRDLCSIDKNTKKCRQEDTIFTHSRDHKTTTLTPDHYTTLTTKPWQQQTRDNKTTTSTQPATKQQQNNNKHPSFTAVTSVFYSRDLCQQQTRDLCLLCSKDLRSLQDEEEHL